MTMARFVPLLGALVPAALWVALAWRAPTSTHHFAPLVVALAWGFLADPRTPRDSATAAVGGVAVALLALLVLAVGDRLQGPTLWGSTPSYPELIGAAVLGGVVTALRAHRRRDSRTPAAAGEPDR
ncbi:MAG: hypothetical protein OEV40_21980 [Acidimicrobiia bacterium]|nr:hypothetical protein [Acidimicrobiia bacterium]